MRPDEILIEWFRYSPIGFSIITQVTNAQVDTGIGGTYTITAITLLTSNVEAWHQDTDPICTRK